MILIILSIAKVAKQASLLKMVYVKRSLRKFLIVKYISLLIHVGSVKTDMFLVQILRPVITQITTYFPLIIIVVRCLLRPFLSVLNAKRAFFLMALYALLVRKMLSVMAAIIVTPMTKVGAFFV